MRTTRSADNNQLQLHHPNNIAWTVQITNLFITYYFLYRYILILRSEYSLSTLITIIMNRYGLGVILSLLRFSQPCFGQPRHAVRSGHTENPVVTDELLPFSCHMFSPFILVLNEYLQLCWILMIFHECLYLYTCPTTLNSKNDLNNLVIFPQQIKVK